MSNLNNTILKDIDLKGGKVIYYDFDIDINSPFEDQKWSCKEDLIQISYYNDKYIIDVGWYPEFEPEGKFTVITIKNYEWETPIFKEKCKNIDQLKKAIKKSIDKIKNGNNHS